MSLLEVTFVSTCLFTGLEEPGPSRVSDSHVSAENVFHEAFVLMGEFK